jgi:hypothetical protein
MVCFAGRWWDGFDGGPRVGGGTMGYYEIEGGKPLRGRVAVGGAKNAATKEIVADALAGRMPASPINPEAFRLVVAAG